MITMIYDEELRNHKIKAMNQTKMEALLDASFREFAKGYQKANTDKIAEVAGVSKGLIFHYFGTKKGLFLYLFQYSVNTIMHKYENMSFHSADFLEKIWELSLYASELPKHNLVLYQFIGNAYIDMKKEFPDEYQILSFNPLEDLLGQLFLESDQSLFRKDINPDLAFNIIRWCVRGFNEELANSFQMDADYQTSIKVIEYDLQKYLETLRKVFYQMEGK